MNEEALRVLEQRENLVAHFINFHVSNLFEIPKTFFKIYYSTLNQISLNDMSINPISKCDLLNYYNGYLLYLRNINPRPLSDRDVTYAHRPIDDVLFSGLNFFLSTRIYRKSGIVNNIIWCAAGIDCVRSSSQVEADI